MDRPVGADGEAGGSLVLLGGRDNRLVAPDPVAQDPVRDHAALADAPLVNKVNGTVGGGGQLRVSRIRDHPPQHGGRSPRAPHREAEDQ